MDIPGLAAHLHAMEQQHLATALQVSASALDSRLPRLPWSGVYHAVAMSGASKMLALRAGEQRRTLHPCSRGVAEFFKFSLFSIVYALRRYPEKSFFILDLEIVQLCSSSVLPHEISAQNCAGFEAKQKSKSSWTHSNPGTWKRCRFLKWKTDGLPRAHGSGKV